MIGLYNNVTANDAGQQTGNLVTASNKLSFILNSSLNEEKSQAIAIRMLDDNHKSVGDITLAFEGSNKDKWAFSLDNEAFGNYGEPLVISEELRAANKILYVKARSIEGEGVSTDVSVTIKITGVVGTIA